MHSPKAPKPSIAQQQSASRANAPVQPFAGSTGSQLGGLLGDQSMWFSYMRPRSRPPLGSLATDPGGSAPAPGGSATGISREGTWQHPTPPKADSRFPLADQYARSGGESNAWQHPTPPKADSRFPLADQYARSGGESNAWQHPTPPKADSRFPLADQYARSGGESNAWQHPKTGKFKAGLW